MDAVNLDMTGRASVPRQVHGVRMIPVMALGMALSLFLVASYLICITTYFLPGLPISHAMLALFLPGFELLNWQSFFLGFVESFAWGWYFALIFGPLYNFFTLRWP
ncbi:MAG: DUF5676 family membrane protein [Pseudomonadota bacterium]|nr:DUF5676 family membrane protein [Pseudomonadota bacterium]